ncbi:MAG: DinB family protein [Syntrophothermus sp.]
MFNSELANTVYDFASVMMPLSEKDLERDWIWRDHDSEGIRFAFFVTLQELRQLAVTLASLRDRPTQAQHILSQYHAAYMDLQAAVLGVSNTDAERTPAEGEWSVKQAYSHILGTDLGFSAVIRYALERHRSYTWTPSRIPDEEYPRLYGLEEKQYDELMDSSLENMLSFHRELHLRILNEFMSISNQELDLPSTFWEETRFPIRHRLHRYEAHFAQHTVQIDKTLDAIGLPPNESKQLLRKIYTALAEAEGHMIGAEKMDEAVIQAAASSISNRAKEIRDTLRS